MSKNLGATKDIKKPNVITLNDLRGKEIKRRVRPPFKEIRDSEEPFDKKASEFSYFKLCQIRDEKSVKSIRFDVSRYGNVKKIIKFKTPTTVSQAIVSAETYLSQKLTEKFYNQIQSDSFYKEYDWNEAKGLYGCRGGCLSDAMYLEGYHVDSDGMLTLQIGS